MRFLAVADRIFSVGDVDGLVRHHLYVPSVEDAFRLLGDHVGDPGLSRVEIVAQLLHGIGLSVLLHLRLSYECTRGVPGSPCIYRLGLQVIFHVVRGELHASVGHGHVPVIVYHPLPVREVLHDGVPCRGECRHVEGALFHEGEGIRPCNGICPRSGVHHRTHGIRNGNGVGPAFRLFHPVPLPVPARTPVLL